MAHYGSLREHSFSQAEADDIRGSAVYGTRDEKLGKIDDVIFDHTTGDIEYVVVDTVGWLKSKKFLVPAARLSQLTSAHEGDFYVPLTKNQIESFPPYDENALKDQAKWAEYETRYRTAWTLPEISGQRWSAFQNRLRTERKNIVVHCADCGPGPVRNVPIEKERKVG
jgi:sporulation protein YlmC with PRC-barrel domain